MWVLNGNLKKLYLLSGIVLFLVTSISNIQAQASCVKCDTFQREGGLVPNIVSNDTINGLPAILGLNGNSTVEKLGNWPSYFELDTMTGAIKVPFGSALGQYKLPYELCDTSTPMICKIDTFRILVLPSNILNPDFNATYKNIPVNGNLSTNDIIIPGSKYESPIAIAGNPTTSIPIIDSTGKYTFSSTTSGVYKFNVPVCPMGITINCPIEILNITVLDQNSINNAPIVNIDVATTKSGSLIKLASLSNDKPGNPIKILDTSSITFTKIPTNGISAVNLLNGYITYTPNNFFTGLDTLKYKVCDNNNPALCAEAMQIITVLTSDYQNTTQANDDLITGPAFGSISGNALKNDTDPEGNGSAVTPQTVFIAGKGTLVLNSNGDYIFTPDTTYEGPVEFQYEKCDSGIPKACAFGTIHVNIEAPKKTNPDVNSTWTGTIVEGELGTNDKVKLGSTYGAPIPNISNPGAEIPNINLLGKYTFASQTSGVYQFSVPVCPPGVSLNCPLELLTIAVKDLTKNDNGPEAFTDIAATKAGTAINLMTLANDKPGNPSKKLDPNSVFIIEQPLNGTTVVDPVTGNITYTPFQGFTGLNTLKYKVCDSMLPAKCAEAYQIFTVLPSNYPNTTVAVDDIYEGKSNVPIIGNVKTNDSDPEGNATIITPQTTTIPGKGTIVLKSDGSFVFTPETGYNGPVDFVYQSCDNGLPVSCAKATLHILVLRYTKTNPDINATWTNTIVNGNLSTNDIINTGTAYSSTSPLLGNPGVETPNINPDGTYTFTSPTSGVYYFNVPVCPSGTSIDCFSELLTISVLEQERNDNLPVVNTDIATTKQNVPIVLNSLGNDNVGNEFSNLVPSKIQVIIKPKNGSTVLDTLTGKIAYTPNPGFHGIDTLKYKICDNTLPVFKCSEAFQIITVLQTTSNNSTVAADDYNKGNSSKSINGNVMSNDSDPEGNKQTITPQTKTLSGKGTLVLNSDGSYIFTPIPGFTGPIEFQYTTCDDATPKACVKATLYLLIKGDIKLNPDLNATFIDLPVIGNLKTNDIIPSGSIYTNLFSLQGNPDPSMPKINVDGSYTFTTSRPGIYRFNVNVCPSGVTLNCPISLLSITVFHPDSSNTFPIANTDIGITKLGVPIALNTLANDKGNGADIILVPSTVKVLESPRNGTAIVDPVTGNITYSSKNGFVGKDTLSYSVCDNSIPAKCATAFQFIEVIPLNAPNVTSASDDYSSGQEAAKQKGNVFINDFDAEGNSRTTNPQTITIQGKGTLVLNIDGSYTFTPIVGFVGPIEFPYTTCDNGIPIACANATLHILVERTRDIVLPNYFTPNGDLENDKWQLPVAFLAKYPKAKVMIYDRWGNQVWRSEGTYKNDWGGEYKLNNSPLPDGVYFYLLELDDNFKTTKTGFIEIMRQ